LVYSKTIGSTSEIVYDLIHLLFETILLCYFPSVFHNKFIFLYPFASKQTNYLITETGLGSEYESMSEAHGQLQISAKILLDSFWYAILSFLVDVSFAALAFIRVTFSVIFSAYAFHLV
jgi:hypothetical protein